MILWLGLILSCLVNLLLMVWVIRLQVEVWANRRVIVALERVADGAAKRAVPRGPGLAAWGVGLLALGQLLAIVGWLW